MNEFAANREFERLLCEFTGAPYAIAVDNCSSAIQAALECILFYNPKIKKEVAIPKATFIQVPYAIRQAGFKPVPDPAFNQDRFINDSYWLHGEYEIGSTGVWDSALVLNERMYKAGAIQCLSFTGKYKHLKLGKAGAILLDNPMYDDWLRRVTYCGRHYVSYHEDTFDLPIGHNYYLHPMIAALGCQLIGGVPRNSPPLRLPYPRWDNQKAFAYAYR